MGCNLDGIRHRTITVEFTVYEDANPLEDNALMTFLNQVLASRSYESDMLGRALNECHTTAINAPQSHSTNTWYADKKCVQVKTHTKETP